MAHDYRRTPPAVHEITWIKLTNSLQWAMGIHGAWPLHAKFPKFWVFRDFCRRKAGFIHSRKHWNIVTVGPIYSRRKPQTLEGHWRLWKTVESPERRLKGPKIPWKTPRRRLKAWKILGRPLKVLEYSKKALEDSWKALDGPGRTWWPEWPLRYSDRRGSLITFLMFRFGRSMCLDPKRSVNRKHAFAIWNFVLKHWIGVTFCKAKQCLHEKIFKSIWMDNFVASK